MGTHEELMKKKGIYFGLVQQQEKQQIEEQKSNISRAQG